MDRTEGQRALRERFLLALAEATHPLVQQAQDREVALQLLVEAADLLKERLQKELEEPRLEEAE